PFAQQPPAGPRRNLALDDIPFEVEQRLLPMVVRVKVRRRVVVEVHSDNDPKEGRDDRHVYDRSRGVLVAVFNRLVITPPPPPPSPFLHPRRASLALRWATLVFVRCGRRRGRRWWGWGDC